MNTPAHVAASVLVWRNEVGWGAASAVLVGAVLPDLPMYGFYAYQKLAVGAAESQIWSQLYFQHDWQLLFDIFNSIPLLLASLFLSYWCGFRWGVLFSGSALLHVICDLPLHHDDAHRHFLPLTHWRFASPFSYWDPRHYGHIFLCLELVFALVALSYVACKGKQLPMRTVAWGTLLLYLAAIVVVVGYWLPVLIQQS